MFNSRRLIFSIIASLVFIIFYELFFEVTIYVAYTIIVVKTLLYIAASNLILVTWWKVSTPIKYEKTIKSFVELWVGLSIPITLYVLVYVVYLFEGIHFEENKSSMDRQQIKISRIEVQNQISHDFIDMAKGLIQNNHDLIIKVDKPQRPLGLQSVSNESRVIVGPYEFIAIWIQSPNYRAAAAADSLYGATSGSVGKMIFQVKGVGIEKSIEWEEPFFFWITNPAIEGRVNLSDIREFLVDEINRENSLIISDAELSFMKKNYLTMMDFFYYVILNAMGIEMGIIQPEPKHRALINLVNFIAFVAALLIVPAIMEKRDRWNTDLDFLEEHW